MRTILFPFVFIILALAFAAAVKIQLHSEGAGEGAFVVLPVSGHVEDIELRVRNLIRGSKKLRGATILLADFGADGETSEICRRLCREFDIVIIWQGDGICDMLADQTGD